MSALIVLISASLLVATAFLVMFIGAVRRGQYDDTTTPPMRMLNEDDHPKDTKP
jgi:cbb3-type cytochrome oxidase maturation protein